MSEYDKSLLLIFRADLPLSLNSFQPTHVNKSKLQKKKEQELQQSTPNVYQFLCNHQSVESTAQLRQLSKLLILLFIKLKWFRVQIKKKKCFFIQIFDSVHIKYEWVVLNLKKIWIHLISTLCFVQYFLGKCRICPSCSTLIHYIFPFKNNVIIILTYLQKWHLQSLFDHVVQTEYWR